MANDINQAFDLKKSVLTSPAGATASADGAHPSQNKKSRFARKRTPAFKKAHCLSAMVERHVAASSSTVNPSFSPATHEACEDETAVAGKGEFPIPGAVESGVVEKVTRPALGPLRKRCRELVSGLVSPQTQCLFAHGKTFAPAA